MPEEIKLREGEVELPTQTQDTVSPYQDNLEYLADHFERIKILRDMQRLRQFERSRLALEKKQKEDELKSLECRIIERLHRFSLSFPFEELKKKKSLSKNEELVVIALLEKEASRSGHFHVEELLDLISQTQYEKLLNRKLLQDDSKLIKNRIIETGLLSLRNGILEYAKLNDKLKRKLLGERKRQKRVDFKGDDLFDVVVPTVPLDKVILHPKTFEDVSLAIEAVHGKASRTLREWGVQENYLIQSTSSKQKHQSVTMLFYGPPGTGKTLSANSIAYFLKRKLITLDCSKVLNAWVGESEQNTRRIFDKYREVSKNLQNPPVLLLNEAEQFLHRRIESIRSTDHMYNQMQNIFLEQLECFEGILITTTNLIDNLDPAFSRRFHHKIEFRRPGPEERLKLWQVHIPEKVPLSDDIDFLYLSKHYDFSGGLVNKCVNRFQAATFGSAFFTFTPLT
ncbi:ATP-binding protein [Candidatus Woesearchaeota archaeon]|nr:ATP-binding protein [Candidatus Woesearchaeota archaeon]